MASQVAASASWSSRSARDRHALERLVERHAVQVRRREDDLVRLQVDHDRVERDLLVALDVGDDPVQVRLVDRAVGVRVDLAADRGPLRPGVQRRPRRAALRLAPAAPSLAGTSSPPARLMNRRVDQHRSPATRVPLSAAAAGYHPPGRAVDSRRHMDRQPLSALPGSAGTLAGPRHAALAWLWSTACIAGFLALCWLLRGFATDDAWISV